MIMWLQKIQKRFMRSSEHDRAQAYKHIFATDEGQIVLADLMNSFHVQNTTMPEDANANKLIYSEGQRSVVLYITSILELENGR